MKQTGAASLDDDLDLVAHNLVQRIFVFGWIYYVATATIDIILIKIYGAIIICKM